MQAFGGDFCPAHLPWFHFVKSLSGNLVEDKDWQKHIRNQLKQ